MKLIPRVCVNSNLVATVYINTLSLFRLLIFIYAKSKIEKKVFTYDETHCKFAAF